MIVIDTPFAWDGLRVSAHLVSDLPGEAGRVELRVFAEAMGLPARWLQEPGTPREHVDVWGSRLDECRAAIARGAGREIPRGALARIIAAKRAAVESDTHLAGADLPLLREGLR